jgi:hypothetical protein
MIMLSIQAVATTPSAPHPTGAEFPLSFKLKEGAPCSNMFATIPNIPSVFNWVVPADA